MCYKMSVASNVVCAELSLYNSSYIVVLQLHGSQVYTCNRFVAPSDVVLIPEVVFIIHLSITFLILAWFTAMMQQFAIASSLISSENYSCSKSYNEPVQRYSTFERNMDSCQLTLTLLGQLKGLINSSTQSNSVLLLNAIRPDLLKSDLFICSCI